MKDIEIKKFKFVAKTPFLSWPRCIYTYVHGAMYIHLCKNSALSKIKEGKGGGSVEYFEKLSMRKLIQQELKVGKKQQLSSCYGLDFQMPMCLTLII